MAKCKISPEKVEETIKFHGHSCPGLAIGIRASELALQKLDRSKDEEIVAIVETDMCGVDAIQYLVGCTFGKGNLIYRDFGKNAFTFFNRGDEKGFRIVSKPGYIAAAIPELGTLRNKHKREGLNEVEEKQLADATAKMKSVLMEADLEEIFDVKSTKTALPAKAHMMGSLTCEECGEQTMESRTRRFTGRTLCIPCFDLFENRM